MTHAEIVAFFPPKPGCQTHLGGSTYAVPTLRWLQGPFWQFFKARLWSGDLDKWKRRWTCRDFTRRYASMAQECWADTPAGKGADDDGISVGEIWFLPDNRPLPQEGHAVCPVITGEGLTYIDPQNGAVWPMTPTEFESRYYCRF